VVLHLPMIAAALALLYWRRRWLFAEHFVVATHLFAFLLLLFQLLLPLMLLAQRFGVAAFPGLAKAALAAAVLGHLVLTLRTVYGGRWWGALLRALALLVLLAAGSIVIYRTLQFLLVLALA
jgi:hypothetical protein